MNVGVRYFVLFYANKYGMCFIPTFRHMFSDIFSAVIQELICICFGKVKK